MAYIKTDWKDKVVEKPRTFTMQNNPDGTVTLIPAEGAIYESGTPVNAANMNKIEQGIEEVTTYTNEQLGKVSYYQNTEPADKEQGKTWFNPDTGQLYVANGTEYQSIPPVQILEEVVDFTETDVYVSNENTIVENGGIRLYTSFTGTTATRLADNSTLSTSIKKGIRILPNKNLEGVKVTISNNTSLTVTGELYLYQGTKLLKKINAVSGQNGSTYEIFYPLQSGVQYDILAGSSSTYTAGASGVATFPYNSADVSIVNGLSDVNVTSSSCYNILSVQASSPLTSGNAIIHWKQQPNNIKAWDLATYQNTLNGGTVTVDIVKNGALRTTATRTNDTSTGTSDDFLYGLKIIPKTTLMGLLVTLSAKIVNPEALYIYDSNGVLLKKENIAGKVAGDSVIITSPLRAFTVYYVMINRNGALYTPGINVSVTYPFISTDIDIVAGARSMNGSAVIEYTTQAYNIVSVRGIGIETLFSNIPQNFDISTISPTQEVWLKVNISRVSTSNIPTCDYIARRYVR